MEGAKTWAMVAQATGEPISVVIKLRHRSISLQGVGHLGQEAARSVGAIRGQGLLVEGGPCRGDGRSMSGGVASGTGGEDLFRGGVDPFDPAVPAGDTHSPPMNNRS